MSIQVTTLKGTNSIASDRITINDNFSINTDAINDILGILDTTTGKFDNTGVGANSTITTEGLTITINGLEVQDTGGGGANIEVQNGYLKLATNGKYIELGADGSMIKDNVIAANNHVLDFATGFKGIGVPKLTPAEVAAVLVILQSLPIGTGPAMVVFEYDAGTPANSKFRGFNPYSQLMVDLS